MKQIIDAHTHVDSEEVYQEYFAKANRQVDKIVVMHWYRYYTLEDLLKFTSTHDNLFVMGSVDFSKSLRSQLMKLEKYLAQGKIVGIKIYPGYQPFSPADKKVGKVAALCQKYNRPMTIHSGDVYDLENKALLQYAHPGAVDVLATRFPDCKIIIAHMGFPYLLETATIMNKNANLYADLSGTLDRCANTDDADRLAEQYAVDLQRVLNYFPDLYSKIMFGTDYWGENTDLNEINNNFKVIEKIVSPAKQEMILGGTAAKVFGI